MFLYIQRYAHPVQVFEPLGPHKEGVVVRFVTFSVVMGDSTDLNVTAAIGNRGATLVSQASPGLPVHWHDHNVHAYLVEGTTDFLDAETGIRYNVGPWMARRGDPRGPSNAHVRACM